MTDASVAADAMFPMRETRRPARDQTAAPGGDSGQPIADPPPLVEPVVAPRSGRRPPRRRFLAPVAPAAASAAPAQIAPLDIPTLIEPVASAAPPPPLTRRWLAAVRAWWPADLRSQLAAVAGIVVVIGFVVSQAVFGPALPVRHYPVSAAPSDPAQRLAYFQNGAQAGDAEAELQLAILYAKGEGVGQDYAAAATWFRAAAKQGVARAQYDLGVLYERGRGVETDLAEAANWYLKAAQAGHPLAEYNLAVCYTRGQGIRKDLNEAAQWYHRAGAQGVVQAMINLGMMYEKGEGVAASPADAYAWYLAAGRRGNQAAAQRAEEVFAGLLQLEQIRAAALASDVAASIHDPEPQRGAPAAAGSETSGAAGH